MNQVDMSEISKMYKESPDKYKKPISQDEFDEMVNEKFEPKPEEAHADEQISSVRRMFNSLINNFIWTQWTDIKTYYEDYHYHWYLVQMKKNNNGRKKFRTVKIAGGGKANADRLRVDVSELN